MFKAIGLVLLIWYLSTVFSSSFSAFDGSMTATFNTVESAAIVSQTQIETR